MDNHPKKERTFVIIKPDGIQRGLLGEIIGRYERTGLKLVGMKFGMGDEKKFWDHYNKDDAWFLKKGTKIAEDKKAAGLPSDKEPIEYGKDIIRQLVKFMTSGPVLMMVWEGNQASAVVKKITGSTEPSLSIHMKFQRSTIVRFEISSTARTIQRMQSVKLRSGSPRLILSRIVTFRSKCSTISTSTAS